MDESTSMVIDINEFAKGRRELLIVLIGAKDELCGFVNKEERKARCKGRNATVTDGRLRKNVTIILEPIATNKDGWMATSVAVLGYFVIAVVCFVVSGVFFKYNLQDGRPTQDIIIRRWRIEGGRLESESRLKESLESRILPLTPPDKSRAQYKKNQLYMVILFIISIFYTVNVLQTAYQAQAMQLETGNNDVCFYNSRCQIPLLYTSYFLDFNHFFSNLGYLVFGLTFMFIVYVKSKRYEAAEAVDFGFDGYNHGIPYLTGVYYSMGGALMMEGIMSAAYHICPTNVSFQYDTTFMYAIAILIYVKLYQNRHPDSCVSSVKAYRVLGYAVMMEAISIYFYRQDKAFWVIFGILYILGVVYAVANIYEAESRDKLKETEPSNDFDRLSMVYSHLLNESLSSITEAHKGKKTRPFLVFISLMCVINVAMCICFCVIAYVGDSTASEFILYIFVINMLLYVGYYWIMKKINNEKLLWKTCWYAGAFPFPFFFFYFFFICSTKCHLYDTGSLLLRHGEGEKFKSVSSRVAGTEQALPDVQLLRRVSGF